MFFCYLFGIVALFCHSCMFKQEEEITLFGKKRITQNAFESFMFMICFCYFWEKFLVAHTDPYLEQVGTENNSF